ncbi:MAG TPA: RNA polymerase sporulation sigma factor SigH [Lachnospiraceae bacterium]|nr:RNA polymerase sporulation sigma factor SigH [Lachnospiraceae bacterium]
MTEYGRMKDDELIRRLRDGDASVTEFIMEKYKNMVRKKAKAMYLLGGENDDLIQEGMIGLFKAVRDYDPDQETSFASFADLCISRQIYSAVLAARRKKHLPLNSYVSIYETENREEEGSAPPLLETIEDEKGRNPEEMLLGREALECIETRLQERLSHLESRVLYLHMQGMDYTTIAKIIDKSPKAVDNALQRIRMKTQEIVEKL